MAAKKEPFATTISIQTLFFVIQNCEDEAKFRVHISSCNPEKSAISEPLAAQKSQDDSTMYYIAWTLLPKKVYDFVS